GLGVILAPEPLAQMPKLVQNIFGSPITSGGIAAILLTLLLPEPKDVKASESYSTHHKEA
ncbi:MAG: xanthine permease XanP, partial [Oceanospirillales bacterium]|nr:xanthine permease XanP [Oceanospirillales bacterium]